MPQLPGWPQEISERLMDDQILAMRMVTDPESAGGPQITPAEQRLLDSMRETQGAITAVEEEINEVVSVGTALLTTIRTGKRPRRMRAIRDESTAA
jgi:hypothetical protein